jgi:hypothetical protein
MDKYSAALIVALVVSILFNVGLVWYLRNILGRLLFISDNLLDLTVMVEAYRKHLKSIYEMEMFYGEPTLEHLLKHTSSLMDLLEDYEDVINIAEPLEATETNKEEQKIEEETSEAPKDVLYAGSRRRDS